MSSDAEPRVGLSIEAQFPQHFFLENIAIRQDNSKLVTAVKPYALYYLPARNAGGPVEPVLLHTFAELASGITELKPDVFIAISANAYTTHENYLHRLDLRGWTPGVPVMLERILKFPKEVLALNGCCALSQTTVLAADTFAGAIWRIDFDGEGRSPQANPWFKHESMAHVKDTLPPPPQPGINGLRYSSRTGFVYYTTTGRKLFMRVRIDPVTFEPVGGPERVAGGGMYDDFCIDDRRELAYLTVHRENRIDSAPLAPGGMVCPLAGAPLNEMMLGPSSAAWSRAPDEAGQVIYVTTDGGQTAPPPDGVVRSAKVLRMQLRSA